MSKVKVFIHDDQQMALPACHRYLNGQTYCFTLETGPGFGLFVNRRKLFPTILVKDDAFGGCIGELWEVSSEVSGALDRWYQGHLMYPCKVIVPATGEIRAWAMSPRHVSGKNWKLVRDYRDTLR